MNTAINWKMVGLGILFIIGGFWTFSLDHIEWWASIFMIFAGIFIIWIFGRSYRLYCADCGQYVGVEGNTPALCPRCGCNVYTRGFNGVGRTNRNR